MGDLEVSLRIGTLLVEGFEDLTGHDHTRLARAAEAELARRLRQDGLPESSASLPFRKGLAAQVAMAPGAPADVVGKRIGAAVYEALSR